MAIYLSDSHEGLLCFALSNELRAKRATIKKIAEATRYEQESAEIDDLARSLLARVLNVLEGIDPATAKESD